MDCFSLFTPSKRLEKLLAADAGRFGAYWWPYASYERLQICTYLGLWLFIWDDETDSSEFSDISQHFDQSQNFRAHTIAYCRQFLGLSSLDEVPPVPTSPLITNFKEVGEGIMKNCSYDQRRWLMNEIEHFVHLVETEQRSSLSGVWPSIDEYQQRRMGTSAVPVCLSITDFAWGFELPQWITRDVEFQSLFDAVNIIISTTNDMLSVKKEISAGQANTLVPLLVQKNGWNAQLAIDRATQFVEDAAAKFRKSKARLLEISLADEQLHEMITKIIEGCEYACTGNLDWSVTSCRYMLGIEDLHGQREIIL